MAGVYTSKRREKARVDVELTTPHGAAITVTAERAEQLLARSAIAFGDGTFRKYAPEGEETEVPVSRSRATPPRRKSGDDVADNSGEGGTR